MSKREDRASLSDILEATERIEVYIKGTGYKGFLKNVKTQDAVIRNLEIVGEAAKNLSLEFRQKHGTVDWKRIAGFRDKLIHQYFGINLEIVWSVAKEELPVLNGQIAQLLKQK